MRGSDPSLTSDPALLRAVAPQACRPGAASSHEAGAAAGAGPTPPTGATAAAHRGTRSLGLAVAAGAVVH